MKQAFTLIELLAVVLIIGILSAAALPQYRVAVLKAHTVQLQVLADALRNAQHLYYSLNGVYAKKFDELDIDLPPGATITPFDATRDQAKWSDGTTAYTFENNASYVRNEKYGIGIHSVFAGVRQGMHICQSYNTVADQVCENLGGQYYGTGCAPAASIAAGTHGCRLYTYP